MKYDDSSWHYDSGFLDDLPAEMAYTQIGMYLAWLCLNRRTNEETEEDFEEELADLRARNITGGRLLASMDEKLVSDDFDDEINAFTQAYYSGDEKHSTLTYYDDYAEVFGKELGSDFYTVADTWENYDKLAARLDARYQEWLDKGRPEYF